MDKETADFILKLAATVISTLVVSVPIAIVMLQRLGKLIPALSQQGEKIDQNTDLLRQALRDRADEGSFYRAQLDKIEKRAETLEEQVRSQALQLIDREHKSHENKRQIEELTTTAQQNQKSLQEKIDALQKDSSTMQQDLTKAQEELARTKAEHEQTKADLAKAQDRIKALEDERDKERAASTVKIEQLTQELETERGKAKDMQTQLDNQAERIKFLESEVQRLSAPPPEPPKPVEPTTP